MSPRNRRACVTIGVFLMLLAGSRRAEAWSDATRLRMLRDALKVTPPSLAVILESHRKTLERGMLEPSKHETEEVHFQQADGRAGLAAAAAAAKEAEARRYLQEKHGLKRFSFEMGTLAHLTADVSFPLSVSDDDAREPLYREAYRSYIERTLGKIPFVLDPAPTPRLDQGDIEGYLQESARLAAKNYRMIGPAFKDDGSPVSPTSLDERSVAFGVTSLAYSQAVNDIARVWMQLWRAADGDMTDAPLLAARKPEPKAQGKP